MVETFVPATTMMQLENLSSVFVLTLLVFSFSFKQDLILMELRYNKLIRLDFFSFENKSTTKLLAFVSEFLKNVRHWQREQIAM